MAGNDIGRAGPCFEPPDGRHEIRFAPRPLFDGERHLGRGGQRVAAQAHGRRARMARDAVHADLEPRCAVDRGDDAKRQPLRLEPRALLDMRLDEGGDALAPKKERTFGIAAELDQRLAHRDAVGVALIERVLRIISGERERARERGAEAHALLIAEGHDLDRVIEALIARA